MVEYGMDKKYIFIALGVVIVVATGIFLKGFNLGNDNLKNDAESAVANGGWVEVLSGEVFLIEKKEDIESKKELSTGDSIAEGSVLETDSKGKATVHFFDGSVLRAGPSTRFTISGAEYNKNSRKLLVKVGLSSGTIWSKIIELATSDSVWQVETSNTVATVRGSAFGIKSDGKDSEIFGSQHKVTVEVVDPKTKEKLRVKSLVVSEGNYLKISDADIQKVKEIEKRAETASPDKREAILKTSEFVFVPIKISEKIKSDEWFTENENADKKIEEEIRRTKEEDSGGIKVEEMPAETENKTEDSVTIKENREEEDKVIELQKEQAIKQEAVTLSVRWNSLKIETKSVLSDLTEGDIVVFRAVLQGAARAHTAHGWCLGIRPRGCVATRFGNMPVRPCGF